MQTANIHPSNSHSNKSLYLAGIRAGIPVIFGFIPVGIAYALMARQAGFTAMETIYMSISVFAGASQMMATGMYAQNAGIAAIVLATFLLNLRHLIMSTCVMNKMQPAPVLLKLLASFGVTDESFALFTTAKEEHSHIAYFFGMITVTYSSWIAGSAIGALASDFLPAILTASFGIALYAMFIGLLVPSIPGNLRLGLLVLLTAVCNTILTQIIPSSWALIVSTLVCTFAGMFFVELDDDTTNENAEVTV